MQKQPETDEEQAAVVEAVLGGERWASCPHCGRACVREGDPDHQLTSVQVMQVGLSGVKSYVTRCDVKKITTIHA